jgi:hypothetical protein
MTVFISTTLVNALSAIVAQGQSEKQNKSALGKTKEAAKDAGNALSNTTKAADATLEGLTPSNDTRQAEVDRSSDREFVR